MPERFESLAMGWLPDYPDFRDFSPFQEGPVKSAFSKIKAAGSVKLTDVVKDPQKAPLPGCVDLRQWCSDIEDQKQLGSCTANAGVGMVEYFERKVYGKHIDASRLFLYKTTRNMMGWNGDTGAFLRTTMGALVLFGVPPEKYWPYTDQDPAFDREPSAFTYAIAQNYQALSYYRLDPPGVSPQTLLIWLKTFLAAGLPSIFGFRVFASYTQANRTGKIPFPTSKERAVGGHAVMAVGYDDNIEIENTNPGGIKTTGAVQIRNSWGTGWGDEGYGYLPYEYVTKGLAVDWWSLINNEWVGLDVFGY
jgi:C1A family cysteine protease